MLVDLVLLVGGIVVLGGVLEVSTRSLWGPAGEPSHEAAIRQAMRGPESDAVLAEFRRSGICPPERTRPVGLP